MYSESIIDLSTTYPFLRRTTIERSKSARVMLSSVFFFFSSLISCSIPLRTDTHFGYAFPLLSSFDKQGCFLSNTATFAYIPYRVTGKNYRAARLTSLTAPALFLCTLTSGFVVNSVYWLIK